MCPAECTLVHYRPQEMLLLGEIGTFVSMMTWMRKVVLTSAKGMSHKDLDCLVEADSKKRLPGAKADSE